MERDRDGTAAAAGPDEPLFGLAVSAEARAATLKQYLDQADAEDVAPFTGWTDHVRAS